MVLYNGFYCLHNLLQLLMLRFCANVEIPLYRRLTAFNTLFFINDSIYIGTCSNNSYNRIQIRSKYEHFSSARIMLCSNRNCSTRLVNMCISRIALKLQQRVP